MKAATEIREARHPRGDCLGCGNPRYPGCPGCGHCTCACECNRHAVSGRTFALTFVTHWVQQYWPNAVIARKTDQGIELRRHNGQLGLAYREVGDPLVLRHEFIHGRHDTERWCWFTAYRIDQWARGEPDPDAPDEWYAREVERMRERAPA